MSSDSGPQDAADSGSGALIPFPRGDQTQHGDPTTALFQWAVQVLEAAGVLKALRDAKTCEELEAIKFEPDHPALIMMIRDTLHPSGKARDKLFKHLSEKKLEGILRNRFTDYKKIRKRS